MPIIKARFIVNSRFIINPALNSIVDQETNKTLRLEPRLMDVLCLLADNENKLVTREHLIKEIWNDYGGADEGLNQAVSFLRKFLDDSNKEIIETIPKKGYIFHALIADIDIPMSEQKITTSKRNTKYIYWFAALLLGIIMAIMLINKSPAKKETIGADVMPAKPSNADSYITRDTYKYTNPDKAKPIKKIPADSVNPDILKGNK
jgi:DNA-binding winged helix-turn-helix (wHTH) protein